MTATTAATAVHPKSRRRSVAVLLWTATPTAVRLSMEATTTIAEYEAG